MLNKNKIKILNLYAGIGGNRKGWEEWEEEIEVTAVEYDKNIAEEYKRLYPKDQVIIEDAHEYLLKYYKEFDFIWSSPPCPTHSITNNFLNAQGVIRYPDFKLWQEIIFLNHFFKGKYVIENVRSYYPPLWPPKELDRHYFWTNLNIKEKSFKNKFNIINARGSTRKTEKETIKLLEELHNIKVSDNLKKKRIALSNCVNPNTSKYIFSVFLDKEKKEEGLKAFR